MNVETAGPKDYNELYELEKEWVKEKISPLMTGYTEKDFMKEMKGSTVFVIRDRNKIIAYLTCKVRIAKEENGVHGISKNEKYADIDSIYVKKEYRNKELGSKLVKHCINEVSRVGYKKIILSADSKKMNKIVSFYKKHGFKVLFTRMMLVNNK